MEDSQKITKDATASDVEAIVSATVVYEDVRKTAEDAMRDGVDIIYLDEPEYTETLNCLLDKLKGQLIYTAECAARPKDAFQFMGIEFVKQE